MAEIKLANGQEVKELRVWNGSKWVAKTGRIFDGVKWLDFIRPPLSFKDNMIATARVNRLLAKTYVKDEVLRGDEYLEVESLNGFNVGDEVTIADGVNIENIIILGIPKVNDNLLPSFYEWNTPSNFIYLDDYKVESVPIESQSYIDTYIDVSAGQKYTISIKELTTKGWLWVRSIGESTTHINSTFMRSTTRTFTPTKDKLWIKLFSDKDYTGDKVVYKNPKLELGSIATPFKQYSHTSCIKVTPTKNSYKKNSVIARTNSVIGNSKLILPVHKIYSVE